MRSEKGVKEGRNIAGREAGEALRELESQRLSFSGSEMGQAPLVSDTIAVAPRAALSRGPGTGFLWDVGGTACWPAWLALSASCDRAAGAAWCQACPEAPVPLGRVCEPRMPVDVGSMG